MTDDKPPSTRGRRSGLLARWAGAFRAAPRDRQALIEMLDQARRSRILDADEFSMLEGVLEVATIQVRDIMIPRGQMVVVERNASPQEMIQIIIDSGHSRFPVIADDRDEVIGILLAKDLLRFYAENERERFHIKECLRPAVFIPESKRLNVLLKEFRVSHNHMAIVVDEYGGVSGLLTIEDVLEQIVGEIDDEHDPDEEVMIVPEQQDAWRVDALTRIEDLNEELGTNFSDADYDTVGGLVMTELGRLPRKGESLVLDGMRFTVLRADRRRVHAVRLRRAAG
ncbi:MAG TPA: transporter associated domain-containing protein [Gammaproteobacteria bacterium]|nr:transporter associated domain-containing protein [Gammaproteobacteria bacterium]HRP86021.1 transporter associated domain-containing protein [Gammaproteobacteria bacterium]